MDKSWMMIVDESGVTEGGVHDPIITLTELQKSANRVQHLAELLWAEVQDYDTAHETYRKQWHERWNLMTVTEQEAIPQSESLAHLRLPRINITEFGLKPMAYVYLETEAPPSVSFEIETVWAVECSGCHALSGFACADIWGERRNRPHEIRVIEGLAQTKK